MTTNGVYRVADLCKAAAKGDVSKIRRILDAQPDLVNVHMAENNEHMAIHYAVMYQHSDAVRVLMEAGANHNAGIYPHRDATGALTMARERGLDDIVHVMRGRRRETQTGRLQEHHNYRGKRRAFRGCPGGPGQGCAPDSGWATRSAGRMPSQRRQRYSRRRVPRLLPTRS